MTPPPPTSTLFPYTTLFRSHLNWTALGNQRGEQCGGEKELHRWTPSAVVRLANHVDHGFSPSASILMAAPAGASPTTPAPAPGSRRSPRPPRPADATTLWRTAVDSRGPWPDSIARAHRVPG